MIGKRPPAPARSHGFGGLVTYIEQAHKAEYTLMSKISSLDNAVEEMRSVSEMNRAVKDPVYHLILSWPTYERPTKEQVNEAVQIQMKALGYSEHQWIAAAHKDSDNLHVHIAINKVNPDTYRVVNPRGDFFIIDRTCREIELKQGWTHDRGPYSVEYVGKEPLVIEQKYRHLLRQLSDGAKQLERYTGKVSFERYAQESTMLDDIFAKSSSWNDLHNRLRVVGLELKQSDGHDGLVLHDAKSRAHVKASCVRGYSHDALTTRLGRFCVDVSESEHEVDTILHDLTRMRATFSERDLDGYVSAFVDKERQTELKRAVIESGLCEHLAADARGIAQFTTRDVLAEEQRALKAARLLAAQDGVRTKTVTAAAVAAAVDRRSMRADQLEVFNRVIKGKRVATVQGRAGVGKTYVMGALREAYEGSGFDVKALGPTNVIADAAIKDGFKEAFTIDKVLHEAKSGGIRWTEKTVLIVDEAGMISNDKYARLMELVKNRMVGKIILVGDDRQLPAVERGGMFSMLASDRGFDCGEIKKITRQKDERQRQAAEHLSRGEFDDAMHIYHDSGLIKWSGTDDESRDALLDAWKHDYEADEIETKFILSYRNTDVDYFNAAVHDYLLSRGKIHTPRTVDGTEYGIDEAVMFTSTNKKLGVTNGMRGVIKSWANGGMTVELENGKCVAIPLEGDNKFKGFRQAHAGTVHKSQGATIARTYLHHTKDWKDASGYVALTRQTKTATVFASREVAVDWRDIARQMKGCMTKSCASAFNRATERHVPQPIIGRVVGDVARLVELITPEFAERKTATTAVTPTTTAIKGWRPEKMKATAELKSMLFQRFLRERTGVDEASQASWIAALATARLARNEEIVSIRAAAGRTADEIKAAAAGPARRAMLAVHQAELRAVVAEARGRHRTAIADMAGRKPKAIEFEGWLERTTQDKDVRQYRGWRLEAHDRRQMRQLAALVDLREVLTEAGWRPGTGDSKTEAWRSPGTEARNLAAVRPGACQGDIKIVLDDDGFGMRWFDAGTRRGGGLDALLTRLYPETEAQERYRRLLAEARCRFDAQAPLERDRLDHRTFDVVQARRDWPGGMPITSANAPPMVADINIKDLVRRLGDGAGDVRIIKRPGGPALLCATHDKSRNIVGWELVSERHVTRVRGSQRGAEHLISTLEHMTHQARKRGSAPAMSRAIQCLTELNMTQMLRHSTVIIDSMLSQSRDAVAFLSSHPRTLTKAERTAIADFPRLSAEIAEARKQMAETERASAQAARAAAETPEVQAALRTLKAVKLEALHDVPLREMPAKARYEFIGKTIDAVNVVKSFLNNIPAFTHKPDEHGTMSAIEAKLIFASKYWLEITLGTDFAKAVRRASSGTQWGELHKQMTANGKLRAAVIDTKRYNPFPPQGFPDVLPQIDKIAGLVDDDAGSAPPAAAAVAKPAEPQPRPRPKAPAWTPPRMP